MNENGSLNLDSSFNLGHWLVQPGSNTISQNGKDWHLENRLMQTLVFLAKNSGQVVSRERFFDTVWQGLVVNEEALSRAISLLRTALDDNARRPEYIQTIPGVGYRLIAEVTANAGQSERLSTPEVNQGNSIAVLPFVNLSDDPGNEYFSEGISEEILNALAQVESFNVVGRTSSFAFKDRNKDLRKIGKALSATHVLEGSVRKAGDQVRITAQLIKTDDGFHLWSETFDHKLEDIFAIQVQIAEAVTMQLKRALLTTPTKITEANPEAYSLYLQARYLERQSTSKSNKQALSLIQQALSIAPEYPEAWYRLASIYRNMTAKANLTPVDGSRLAREAAKQALVYNPDYAPAYALLGWLDSHFEPDLASAAKHFQRALALAPTDLEIISSAASLARSLGRLNAAIALREYTTALDPVNPVNHTFLGFCYRCAGRFDEAIASYRVALRLSPGILSAQYNIGASRMLQGRPQEALAETLQEEVEGYRVMGLAPIYHDLGMTAESDEAMAVMIEKYAVEGAYNIAFMFAYRGENDLAFEWLEKALQGQDAGLTQINSEPIIANLYSDSRWEPFMQRIGMSAAQLAAIAFDVKFPTLLR